MIHLPSLTQLDRATKTRIWLCTGPTDMRRGFYRLSLIPGRQASRRNASGRCSFSGHIDDGRKLGARRRRRVGPVD